MAGSNPQMLIRIAADMTELKKNLAEGKVQIETTTAAMQRMASSYSGDKLIQSANNTVAAINQIGGASKLTEAEMARVNATLDKAIAKYAALGREAPPAMIALADATKKVEVATSQATPRVNDLRGSMQKFDGVFAAAGLSIGPQVQAIGDIGEASGKSAKELGVLSTAGLVLGAAVAGWKIGRLVADFFDLDTKIGNATARLLGYGDVAAQVGGAKQDSINLAIKRGAAATIDYTEAIKYNAEWMGRLNTGAAKVAESVKATSEAQMSAWKKERAEIERLAAAHAQLQKEMMAFHLVLDQKMIPAVDAFAFNLKMVPPPLEEMIPLINAQARAWPAAIDASKIYTETWEKGGKAVSAAKFSLDSLVGSIAQLAQIGGGNSAFSGIVSGIGGILGGFSSGGKGLDAVTGAGSMTSKIAGLATMASGYGAVAMAAIAAGKAIFKAMNDGRKAVEDFAKSSGGFDSLHAEMEILGDEGERLWIKLTQGTKKGDKAGAQKVIDEITAALERQRAKTAEVDAATAAAQATQAAAIEAITAKYAEQLSALDTEYKSLSDSVGKEADEAVRGVQETQDRARMEQIQIEKDALEAKKAAEIAASEENYDAQVEAAKTANDKIRDIFKDPIRIPIEFEYPGAQPGSSRPSSYGASSGARAAVSARAGVSAQPIVINNYLNMDGREVARNQVRHLPTMLAFQGN